VGRVSRERYLADLNFMSQKPRPPLSAHWLAVQDRAADELAKAGYEVARQRYATGVNVLATKRGLQSPDELVMVGAHYDGIPACTAADDNASGAAGALETARALSSGRFARTLVVALWDEEERGFLGSDAHAALVAERGERVSVAFVYEMIGYRNRAPGSQDIPLGFDLLFPEAIGAVRAAQYRGDFLLVASDDLARASAGCLAEHAASVGLPTATVELSSLRKRAEVFRQLHRSDHVSFWARDYPAMMLTDTADFRNKHYHCGTGPDAPGDLDADFATAIIKATVGAAADALSPR
jgi:Zn-dependent M28 family amino/carboxypeptidase